MAKVDVFKFTTLSNIFGRIGGLYSMLTLLSGIGLMYHTRQKYLENIVHQLKQDHKEHSEEELQHMVKERMQTGNIFRLYDTI